MIVKVEMINWRAYEQRVFKFKPGINFIMGPNGKGKTSILEAVAYGLTGEVSTVTDRKLLLRNPSLPGTVKLALSINGKQYRVERTQLPEKAGEAVLLDENEKVIATFHNRVTEKLAEIIGVSSDFLGRIVYMAEGDVFRFLKDPPGKAMNEQVRRVLGLTQFDEFQRALSLAGREIRERGKTLDILQKQFGDLKLSKQMTLEEFLAELDMRREQLRKQGAAKQDERSMLQRDHEAVITLRQLIQARLAQLQADPVRWVLLQKASLVEYFEDLRGESDWLRRRQAELENTLAGLNSKLGAHERVLEILSATNSNLSEIDCPVCKRPMAAHAWRQVIQEAHGEEETIRNDVVKAQHDLTDTVKETDSVVNYMETLREVRNNLVHSRIRGIHDKASLSEVRRIVDANQITSQMQTLVDSQAEINQQIDQLDELRARYRSMLGKLNDEGFSDPNELNEALIQLEVRQLTLDAANQAANDTLTDMQDIQLVDIYNQIAAVWNNFMRSENWRFRFDGNEGIPRLLDQSDREFDFGQLSGGEKTALLVMIHTVIAHYFSRCDFLLVDEPLEHLDPVNRRSLMRFFISAQQNHLFGQALITTYEEALVRKYLSYDNINIIYIR